MKLLLAMIRLRAGGFALALLLAALTLAAGAGLLGVSGWFLTGAALAGIGARFDLFAPSALVRSLSFLRIVSRYGERMTGHAATLAMLADLRAAVFARLIPLVPLRAAFGRATGDFVARLTADIEALDAMVMLQAVIPLMTALLAAGGLSLLLMLTLPEALPIGLAGFTADGARRARWCWCSAAAASAAPPSPRRARSASRRSTASTAMPISRRSARPGRARRASPPPPAA